MHHGKLCVVEKYQILAFLINASKARLGFPASVNSVFKVSI